MIPRILISGDRSSSGKTTVSVGLMANLRDLGYNVQAFKVGLDYIDPSYHTFTTGRPSRNIDGLLMDEDRILDIFSDAIKDADISVIEGVRGLYEGYSALNDVGSSAQIAKMLKTPVILVIDARSITRSAAALANGYQAFDPDIRFGGVILNHLSGERHEKKATDALNEYTDLKVLGAIPREKSLDIEMRHLGLIPAREGEKRDKNFLKTIERIEEFVREHVDIEEIIKIARSSEEIHFRGRGLFSEELPKTVKIGVALDEVFNFYYFDNLNLLERAGAELIYFSPTRDKGVPNVDGLYLGGGYPEVYAEELEKNKSMLKSIRGFCMDGKPVFAECGGLIYLMDEIHIGNDSYSLAGVIGGHASMNGEKRVVSYVKGGFLKDGVIGRRGENFLGHEFHRSDVACEEKDFRIKLSRGKGIGNSLDGVFTYNTLASYTHFHASSFTPFAKNFVESCGQKDDLVSDGA